jgi:hypothetical protein
MSFGDGSSDSPVDPPVFNAFEHTARQEDRELREFLCSPTSNGTVKSINSVTGFDSGKYATVSSSRPSFSSTSTLRDITASLRSPGNRASGMWGSFGRNSEKNVRLSLTVLIVGISIIDAYDEFGILFEKRVFGYCFCEWVCGIYFSIFHRGFKYFEFRRSGDADSKG